MIKKTLVLRLTLLIIAAVLLLFGFLTAVQLFTSEGKIHIVIYIAAAVVWIDMILGLFIVYALNKLLTLIDINEIFSNRTLNIMNRIQKLTLAISLTTVGLMPFFFTIAQLDDAPGLVLFGTGIVFIPFSIYILVVVLKETLSKAVSVNQENELTI